MDSIFKDLTTMEIGFVVANFLRNTNRPLQAIQLCEECLMLLLDNSQLLDDDNFKFFYSDILKELLKAYWDIVDFKNAERCVQELLVMSQDSGDTQEEGGWRLTLARSYLAQHKFEDAKEGYLKALDIIKVNGVREDERRAYDGLAFLSGFIGDIKSEKEYLEKSLLLMKETGDKKSEAECYSALGRYFLSVNDNRTANEYFQKAHGIRMEIGGREELAAGYEDQADFHSALGDHEKAVEYWEKRLSIILEIGNRIEIIAVYHELGTEFCSLGKFIKAEEYLERALLLSSISELESLKHNILLELTKVKFSLLKTQEAHSYLLQSIELFEKYRNFNKHNEQLSIPLLEYYQLYKNFSIMLFYTGSPREAFSAEELGRARALADLIAAKYSPGVNHISADLKSLSGVEKLISNESNCTYLYLSYHERSVRAAILKPGEDTYFSEAEEADIPTLMAEHVVDLHDLFNKSFRSFGVLPRELCEDRSLDDTDYHDESLAPFRGNETADTDRDLQMFYKLIIAPVANLLTGPEIVIVPERSMFRVPFAALREETGEKFLTEKFRIRIAPSLKTLKLIQDSPADYHSHTGTLIVGDPEVGVVLYKGAPKDITALPCARREAEMIGRLMDVQPLIGEHATKQAVLNGIDSVSLIHIAAHGNAERGQIALAPNRRTESTGISQEEDYLMTMEDISKVQLRAKLVVLSCCHSGRGQINCEGVVGIARAFLGSGARSVLVSRWALEDTATEQLMNQFYAHLADGESASESLHQAMKWMRNNRFTKVSQWAPFMLIGDDVRIDLKSKGKF
ncbi:unnamed protein product [Pocillopora meandrina]|uniref:CHAT domain-containing protein n=1 Tax=Pocillopora meandrina TaxID=46732 RepID=A0AAU9WBG1_9CNID|nr:unnamed protein product [Pocillopora meandrina]